MSDRGQRQTLRLGRVAVEVSLLKSSSSPREAQHETRRVDQLDVKQEQETVALEQRHQLERELFDVIEGPSEPEASADDPTFAVQQGEKVATAPASRVLQGVTNADGVFVDLTDQLKAIDERCLISGMDIAATVRDNVIRAEWVRDAYYIAPAGPTAPKVLSLLWHGLRKEGRVALVRWTKRTNQALGAVTARGTRTQPYLVLVELEWATNVKALPPRCVLTTGLEATTETERAAVHRFVAAYAEKPDVILLLRDERMAQRAELLEAAREGRAWEAPEVAAPPAENLADLFG